MSNLIITPQHSCIMLLTILNKFGLVSPHPIMIAYTYNYTTTRGFTQVDAFVFRYFVP